MATTRPALGLAAALASTSLRFILTAVLLAGISITSAAAQGSAKNPSGASPSARQAVTLAEHGRCAEALPVLKRSTRSIAEKQLRFRAAMAAARCAMSMNDSSGVADALDLLRRDFPDEPEVLYVSARFYSQLAGRAAEELAQRFPNSAQVGKLNAEALESKGMWNEAIAAYRKLLQQDPKLPGIRFRIASILLDRSSSPEAIEEARKELEEELKFFPDSASAEFALGEIARRRGEWDDAILHFTRASQFDAGFFEAYLALGMSLSAAGKFAEAIAPLERYSKNVPADPAGHYQLAIAYSRIGNKAAADRALELHRQALAKAPMRRPPGATVPP